MNPCERQRQRDRYLQEERFAEAMREMKEEETRQSAFEKQLYACAPEIRELERDLRRGYYAKTLYAQRLEGEALKLEEKMRQQENYELLMEKLQQFDQEQDEKRREEWQKKKDYYKALKNQLDDVTSKHTRKREDDQKYKEMIDEIVESIKQEEIQDLVEKTEKVKLYRSEIGHFLNSREVHREREKERLQTEDENIKKYLVKKEAQVAEQRQAKEEQEKAKASIVAKAIDRIMKEQFKQEELEELRRELHEEELAEEVRRKELEELARKHRQMMELRAAADEARKLRADKLLEEKKEEDEYRAQLMGKFRADDRLEQMAAQKRRQREREHGKIVEQMIADRRCLRAQERERDQQMLDCFDEETKRREKIIDEERIKLLKKHGPKLLGFLPRGTIKNREELDKLGEPFRSYYYDQPTYPDPSTVDLEECEEEIFKTMEVPKNAKY